MKRQYLTALVAALFSFIISFGQRNPNALFLKSGTIIPEANVTAARLDALNQRQARHNNKIFAVIQFQQLPSEEAKKQLAAAGIQLLDYIPNNAYTVSITGKADVGLLQRLKARAVIALTPEQKMYPALSTGAIPGWAQKVGGTVDVQVSFPKTFPADEVIASLKEKNIDILSTQYVTYHILSLRIAINRLTELASLPFIAYVEPVPPENEPLNYNSRVGSRANMLNASVINGGKGLNGEGVTIGIGDDGNVTHTDFTGRLISRGVLPDTIAHANHTHGTAAGAGIINELYRGYASKATLVSDWFQNIITKAPVYVKDYGMVITSNSYGGSFSCGYAGTYDMSSQILDQEAFDFPNLQNVFAAGNSGDKSCSPYPTGFKTVLGGYQSAKNVISVGNVSDEGSLFYQSSKGPLKDGRIKPEIVADGTNVTSTWLNNGYGASNGTSMASPAVAGGLALLYQRYRQLHGNADPKSALMKAVLCNGATDKGNDGPDYSYGFGYMNLVRSLDILENNHYFIGNSTNGSANEQVITVPANTSQVKVMLYWHDPAPSLLSNQALVNDLDLEVIDPSANIILPRKLDTTATNVTMIATTGSDHINNIEQVIINNPMSGNYTIRVKGTAIAQNPLQEYVVAYDMIPVSLQLTYPVGGEGLVPGASTKISWDSYGDPTATFTLQYSIDNGTTWNTINSNIAAGTHFLTWVLPSVTTEKARVRILKNGTSQVSTSNAFTIIGVPAASLAATQCESYIALNWTAVANATDYEVMMLQGDDMVPVTTTTATAYTFSSLSKDSSYWVSVRARINGKSGRRAVAISRQPNTGNCSGSISDNDLKLDSIIAPTSGRSYTSSALTDATPISVQIKNLDDAPASSFTVSYSINDGAWVTENVAATIAAGGVYTHTFAAKANMAGVGNYKLVAMVKNTATDVATANNTLVQVIKQLDNQPVSLAPSFVDDLENADVATYQKDTIGITGLDRYDFNHSLPSGRLQTFVNTGISYSGSKSFTMDKSQFGKDSSVNYLTGTFNLSQYHINTNDVRLDFRYIFSGHTESEYNKIWARGKDTDPWVEVYSFKESTTTGSDSYQLSPSIEIADSLKSKGQDFSSSFQIRWGQSAKSPSYDMSRLYSIDDIHIYEVNHDMQLVSVDTPVNLSCNLSNAVPLKVTIRNNSGTTLTNIPVKFSINDGTWVAEIIPSISEKTAVSYTFSHTLDLSNPGYYAVRVLVDYPDDNYHSNDTIVTAIHTAPFITSFPYLQNFEGGDGAWYASGTNSSWEYGIPGSGKINRAASGAKAWKTRLTGNYNDLENSYLYSPCFDISNLAYPTLSFSMAYDLEGYGTAVYDVAWIEYTTDNKTWTRLVDADASGTNWYNASNRTVWSGTNTRWHVVTVKLPKTQNVIRLRFVLSTDESTNLEGVAIDDIHVYDNPKGIYVGSSPSGSTSKNVNGGTSWIDFESGGQLVASIQPNNQNLGNTTVQAFMNTAGVRDTANQYYHDRNIIIQPQNTSLFDSVSVRFYFTDAETEALINAAGCGTCIKPASAYELGVSKYSNTNTTLENGTIKDNDKGNWLFINPENVTKVPFDKGYYAEFKVKNFSEFWLNKSAFSSFTPLPVTLRDFTATKLDNTVLLKWDVAMETDIERYEIEVAKGNQELQQNRFVKIGAIKSINSIAAYTYSFNDDEAQKSSVRYYRIKIVERTGAIKYSAIRSVLFATNEKWIVFPNPSTGIFHITCQLPAGEMMEVKITDVTGRIVRQFKVIGDGFAQKQIIDLSGKQYSSGVYLLQASNSQQQQSYKLYKQ